MIHAEGPWPAEGAPSRAPRTQHPALVRPGRAGGGPARALPAAPGGRGWAPGTGPRPAGGARTLQEGAALAVRGAPEPGRAVLAARQQALPVRAQAEPVDAPTVLRADPQGRSAAPHPAGRAGGEGTRRPLGKGAPASALRAASSRGHPGGGGPGSCGGGHRARRGKRGTLAPAPPTRLPASAWAAHLGPPTGRRQPHGRRAPPLSTPPGETCAPPEQALAPARASWAQAPRGPWGARVSPRGAGGGGNAGQGSAPRPARPPRPAPRARGGGVRNNTVGPGSSSETTPQPVPSHFSGPRSGRHPPPRSLGTDLSPRPGTRGERSTGDPPGCPAVPLGSRPLPPPWGPKPGTRGGVDGEPGSGGARPGARGGRDSAARPPRELAAPRLPARRTLPAGRWRAWGAPLLERARAPLLGSHTHLGSKEVQPGQGRAGGREEDRWTARGCSPQRSGSLPGAATRRGWGWVPGAGLQPLLCPAHLAGSPRRPPAPPARAPTGLGRTLGGSPEASAGTPTPERPAAGSY